MWEALVDVPDAAQRARLEGLLAVADGERTSALERLRPGPTSVTAAGLLGVAACVSRPLGSFGRRLRAAGGLDGPSLTGPADGSLTDREFAGAGDCPDQSPGPFDMVCHLHLDPIVAGPGPEGRPVRLRQALNLLSKPPQLRGRVPHDLDVHRDLLAHRSLQRCLGVSTVPSDLHDDRLLVIPGAELTRLTGGQPPQKADGDLLGPRYRLLSAIHDALLLLAQHRAVRGVHPRRASCSLPLQLRHPSRIRVQTQLPALLHLPRDARRKV